MVMDKRSARCAALFALVCAAAAVQAVSAVSDGPLQNGNFEYAPEQSQMMNGSVVTAIPNWKISGHVEYITSGQKQGDMILPVPEGAHAVRLGNDASIQQQISVTQGADYALTFSASRTCAQDEKLVLTVVPGYQTSEVPIQTIYTSCGWDYYSWAFKAHAPLLSLTIHNPGQEDDPACGPIIDAVAIKAIRRPDPTPSNNLLRNGDFEEGPYVPPGSQSGVLVPPKTEDHVSPLPGWKIMAHKKVVRYVDSAHFAVPQGARAVELVSGGESALMQEVGTVVGTWYRLALAVGSAGDGCAAYEGPMRVQVTAGSSGTKTVEVYGGAQRAELVFQATETTTRVVLVSLGYHTKSDNSGTLCGPVVDDVSLVATSQPPARRLLI
ncbi:hypothetical protein PR202_gb15180 [Eleusine coracana subsp. coracana]|uniref:DUF642 domain-containing protein n=1 Tax=Eleusine coracana subsp. coracana TaxID=191504 RepID=A0AAV5EX69_ELECO|nr:hypothetical protein PR202_gb15180 [Eleusine coracana subsp. coracana]